VESVELAVRLTARLSAAVFAAALALFALRRAGRPAVGALATFIVIHSVHFATVVWLAAISGGGNIRDRGGWTVVLVVAAVFYAAAFTMLRAWRRAAAGGSVTTAHRVLTHTGAITIWLIFMNSYVSRIPSDGRFAIPAIVLTLALVAYLWRGLPASAGRAAPARSLQ
jgi:hypothetical protein